MTYLDPIRGVDGHPFEKRRKRRKKNDEDVEKVPLSKQERDVLQDKVDRIRQRLQGFDRGKGLQRLRNQQEAIDAAKAKGVKNLKDLYQLSPDEVLPFFEE